MNKQAYNYAEAKVLPDLRPGAPSNAQQSQSIDYLLPRKTVEVMSGLSRATIYRLMKAGKFPRPLSIGTGAVRWRQSEVIAWQQSLKQSTLILDT